MSPPKYLTGDKKAIKEFVDRFDVSTHISFRPAQNGKQLKGALPFGLIVPFLSLICHCFYLFYIILRVIMIRFFCSIAMVCPHFLLKFYIKLRGSTWKEMGHYHFFFKKKREIWFEQETERGDEEGYRCTMVRRSSVRRHCRDFRAVAK